jgi:hypothetical protein
LLDGAHVAGDKRVEETIVEAGDESWREAEGGEGEVVVAFACKIDILAIYFQHLDCYFVQGKLTFTVYQDIRLASVCAQ